MVIKGWYAKHKDTGKWHKIEDVKDTGIPADQKGGGNNYHLEGVGPVHQSKIADMQEKPPMEKADKPSSDKKYHIYKDGYRVTANGEEMTLKEIEQKHGVKKLNNSGHIIKPVDAEKYDRIDEEADGKREFDYGSEELNLKKRWSKMKKALSSDDAIMTIESQEFHEEDQDGDVQQDQQANEQVEQGADQDSQDDQMQGSPMEGEADGATDEGDGDIEQLAQLLREEGYSDAEIAYIVHNHMMPQSTVDDMKIEGEKQSNANEQAEAEHELEHKRRMSDLEYETAQQEQGINELDKEHKKRMLDLEYDAARREKEMELEFKKKELEAKLQAQKERATHQLKMKKDIDKSRAQDAAKTSSKERAGK